MRISAQSVRPGWRAMVNGMGLREVDSVELCDDLILPVVAIYFKNGRPDGGTFPQFFGPMEEIEVEAIT